MPKTTPPPHSQPRLWGLTLLTAVSVAPAVLLAGPDEAPSELPVPRPVAGETIPASTPPTRSLDVQEALRQALLHNPLLATVRRQRGIAEAGVVIARQYPFNPIYQSFIMGDGGPANAGITNRVFNEHVFRLDLEIRGQGKHRTAAALAALSRAEYDIATQEVAVGVSTLRAFQTVLYRQGKLRVQEETVRLNEETVKQVQRLVELGKLRGSDLILARTEVSAARAGIGQGRTALAVARSDLRRLLGVLDDDFAVQGSLDLPLHPTDPAALQAAAVEQRPDVGSRRAAIDEAEARWKLECANRFGNPSLGPAMEYNETSVTFVGGWLVTPLPILNTRKGEIRQREAEVARARQELAQFEFQAQQEVQAALARLADALAWKEAFDRDVIPNLTRSRADLEKLFGQGDPGVDVLRLIDVQRKLLLATSTALDARYEVAQAQADLAAALGDPLLAVLPAPLPVPPPAH